MAAKGSRILGGEEADLICKQYEQGQSLQELAEEHYCSTTTIASLLESKGVARRGKGKCKYNRAMILNDMNAYVPIPVISSKYKISIPYLYNMASQMRKDGEFVVRRNRHLKAEKERYLNYIKERGIRQNG